MTKTIILACVGGLTTSMLVERIQEVIYRDKLDYSFYSVGITGIDTLKNIDVLLLGPQLAYLEEKAKASLHVPVAVISDDDFENMRGEEVHHTLDNRTDPGWPTTWFAPRLTGKGAFKSVYDVMNNWGANHGAISYGHIGADLITLASMLRIPVNMHNVAEEDIFRPKNWSLFGTEDLESADYRACQLLGPIHK